jgi:hypothetical protein
LEYRRMLGALKSPVLRPFLARKPVFSKIQIAWLGRDQPTFSEMLDIYQSVRPVWKTVIPTKIPTLFVG